MNPYGDERGATRARVVRPRRIEQGTKLRQPVSELNPSMYRCAKTEPKPPYAKRGDCNPTYDDLESQARNAKDLPFSLELASVADLQERMTARRSRRTT